MISSIILITIHKISYYKVRVSTGSVETRWLGDNIKTIIKIFHRFFIYADLTLHRLVTLGTVLLKWCSVLNYCHCLLCLNTYSTEVQTYDLRSASILVVLCVLVVLAPDIITLRRAPFNI
jgi:hypothetical protein